MAYYQIFDEKIVGRIPKGNKGDEIFIKQLVNPKGIVQFYDIRRYYKNDAGEMCPTKQGVRLDYDDTVRMLEVLIKTCDVDTFYQVEEYFKEREANDGEEMKVSTESKQDNTDDMFENLEFDDTAATNAMEDIVNWENEL